MESRTFLDFGDGFTLAHTVDGKITGYTVTQYGSLHRLTPEQFDSLIEQFEVTGAVRTLEMDSDTYETARTFRTAEINFGGLRLSIFADVPAEQPVDPNQMSLI